MTSYYTGMDPLGFLLGIFVIVAVIGLLAAVFGPTKARRYRRELADLYVAAKIKEIAAKENISIPAEYECFKLWCKKKKIEDLSLDSVIAEELKDKVTEDSNKKFIKEGK